MFSVAMAESTDGDGEYYNDGAARFNSKEWVCTQHLYTYKRNGTSALLGGKPASSLGQGWPKEAEAAYVHIELRWNIISPLRGI